MTVRSIDQQRQVMIEAVQNHTPDVMVIDEIGRAQECEAAATVKYRGVRLVATAHGTFRGLMKNPALRNLLGGFERVILGDREARPMMKGEAMTGGTSADGGSELRKLVTQRAGDPVFDVIVELSKTSVGDSQLRIIDPVHEAVHPGR